MTHEEERWRRVESLCSEALARPASTRLEFLQRACGDDEALRREVESLVARASRADEFLEGPVAAVMAGMMTTDSSLLTGRRFGAFELGRLLGAGGMGRVYRARDTQLGRDVAIKVLPAAFATDADRLARFDSEARVLASFNHPHIAAIYGLEKNTALGPGQAATPALVLELVEGETLAELLTASKASRPSRRRGGVDALDAGMPPGALPLDEALTIARQTALALEAAHERGIVHRDLKPANIKITPDGVVKVLDFGLAKALDAARNVTDTAAVSAASVTEPGMILGTAHYMAPEQAKGLEVDRRVDLWAFGCLLFELLTGRRAFEGETLTAVLLAVTTHSPDWDALPAATPPGIRTLLRRCLEKDPRRRMDSAAVARIEIDEAIADLERSRVAASACGMTPTGSLSAPPASAPAHASRSRHPALAAKVALAAAATAAASFWLFPQDEATVTGVLHLENPMQITSSLDVEGYPTWSPDGRRLAYQATPNGHSFIADHDIWVTQIGSGEPVNLTKGSPANDRRPSWSPDGAEIAFYSDRGGEWGVYAVSSIGGTPRKLLSLPGMEAQSWSAPQWSHDAKSLVVSARLMDANAVFVLELSSLSATKVMLPAHDGNVCWDLSVSPDGGRFAYVAGGGGSTEITQLWSIGSTGDDPRPLTDGRTNVWSPTWSSDGRTIYYLSNRGGSMDLWQQALQPNGSAAGEPVALTRGLGIRSAALSRDGSKLAYSSGGWVANVWRAPLLRDRPVGWADARPVTSEHAFIEFVDVSPDGKVLALSSDRRGNQDLWRLPADGGEMTPLTTDPAPDWNPRWSPDGTQVAFYSYRGGSRDIWVMPATGGQARQLSSGAEQDMYPSWSSDGRRIAFRSGPVVSTVDSSGGGLKRLPIGGLPEWAPDGRSLVIGRQDRHYRLSVDGGDPVPLPATTFAANYRRLSRDGRFLYYSVINGPRENHDFYRLSLSDGSNARLTQLQGRRGSLGYVFATDDRDLYFTWREDEGDIWVMDVAKPAP